MNIQVGDTARVTAAGHLSKGQPGTVTELLDGGRARLTVGRQSYVVAGTALQLLSRVDEDVQPMPGDDGAPEAVMHLRPRSPFIEPSAFELSQRNKESHSALDLLDRILAAEAEASETVTTELTLARIRVDGGTQARAGLNWATIADYAEMMTEGVEFPPVIVCFDGADYWLADGFHRYHAAKQAGLDVLRVEIRDGDARAARLYAAGANGDHGLPRTNDDKRRAVLLLLNDPEWAKWSDREIARRCAVTHSLVGKVRGELSGRGIQIGERVVERGGQTYTQNTAGIRASNAERAAKPGVSPEPGDCVHIYKTGERAGVSDVVRHYRPGCGGVVASVDRPDGVTVEWREWNGEAQRPPYDVSPPMQPRDLSLVRRGYEEAALVAESVRPSHVTEDGEIVRADEPAAEEVARAPVPSNADWRDAWVLLANVNGNSKPLGFVMKLDSGSYNAYRMDTLKPTWFATHQEAVEWLEGRVKS
jgi:hypothetical protein